MNKVNEICDITAMLADIMRYSIDQSKDIVTIQEEYEHTQKYTGIQRIRYADNLSFFMDLPKEMLNVRIPKLTLQPLVENAILHGFENKREVGKIKILGIVDEEFIKIRSQEPIEALVFLMFTANPVIVWRRIRLEHPQRG